MYATFSDLLRDLFGLNIPLPIQTFGLVMAIAFAAAYVVSVSELKRKESIGHLKKNRIKVWINKKSSNMELLVSTVLSALVGYKFLAAIFDYSSLVENPQKFLLSTNGSLLGLILGAAYGYYSIYSSNKKLEWKTPELIQKDFHPYQHMWNVLFIAAVAGILGAKIFHNLENIDELINNPIEAIFSFSGLTFYGGLIVAALSIFYYANKKGLSILHLCDATAPALMLAYGIGRIGCHLSGDGDWGIVNSAYSLNENGTMIHADNNYFQTHVLSNFAEYYSQEFNGLINVQSIYFKGWDFLPNWFWAFNYHNNVLNAGISIPNCSGAHCYMLPNPVFPTALYEAVACILLFSLLWLLRKRFTTAGVFFFFYLVLNGLERFFIEKIRVNETITFFGFQPSQAEIISTIFILLGLVGMWYLRRKSRTIKK